MSLTLTLIRHGQTIANVTNTLQGQSPGQLTEEGRHQALLLQEKLPDKQFDVLLCSDLKRAVDTAQILNEKLQLPIVYDPLLRERNLGEYVGLPYGTLIDVSKPNVESVEQAEERAKNWLSKVHENYEGKSLLIVSHGFFLRIIQSVILGKYYKEIEPMMNTEIRRLEVDKT